MHETEPVEREDARVKSGREVCRVVLAIVVAALALGLASGCEGGTGTAGSSALAREARVTKVVDGDTAWVRFADGGAEEKVRFIGVDTPESTNRHEPYGEEASAYAHRELDDRTVWLETDAELRDRYGRLLAYVWLEPPGARDDADLRAHQFNARLLLEGCAQQLTIPPNVRYAGRFTRYAREAREARRGLWSL